MQFFLVNNGIKAPMIERTVSNPIKENCEMVNLHIKEQKSVVILLENIIPYLLIKKDLAIEALKYTKERLEKCRCDLVKHSQEKKKYWESDEIEILINMQNDGYSNNAIANKLNRSKNSVSQKLKKLHLIRNIS